LPAVGVPSHILDLPFTTHAAHARGFALSGARARVILVCAVALALMTTLGRAPIAHALSVHLNLAVVKAHLPHSRAGREAPEHEFGGGRPPAAPQARGWARGGNHGTILQYSYDAFGRRVHKQKRTPDGHLSNNNFLWDGEVLAADLDDQRGPRVFVHEPGTFLPVLQQQDGEVFLSVNDHLGMPKDLVSADGLVAWSAQHSAYGKVVAVDADDAAKARYGEGGPSSPFRLLGQVADEDAEICWTRFRCFDAESGRWLTPDPLGVDGGLNLSGFDGAPTRVVDPRGLTVAGPAHGPPDRVDAVLDESARGSGNFGSVHRLTEAEALSAGERWVGPGYQEMGGPGTGVFRSADGTRQFRVDEGSITGAHGDVGPHVHFETLDPNRRGRDAILSNNHVPLE
jgi:RHS repeat-associated protein